MRSTTKGNTHSSAKIHERIGCLILLLAMAATVGGYRSGGWINAHDTFSGGGVDASWHRSHHQPSASPPTDGAPPAPSPSEDAHHHPPSASLPTDEASPAPSPSEDAPSEVSVKDIILALLGLLFIWRLHCFMVTHDGPGQPDQHPMALTV